MYDPFIPDCNSDNQNMRELDDNGRLVIAVLNCLFFIAAFVIAVLICSLFGSCSTQRTVEENHHHFEADTMAVRQQVDRQLTSWHEDMTQFFTERLEQFSSQMQQSEHQQETITESVTVSLDSLGREIRTEQRTISRDITRELQQQDQRIKQEMHAQFRVVVDSVNDMWQSRYDSLAFRIAQMDSTIVKKTPVGDTRPWYRRLFDNFYYILIAGVLFAVIIFISRKWWPIGR